MDSVMRTDFTSTNLCHLQCILCLVQCFDNFEELSCSDRRPPMSKQKNCDPVFSEHAMSLNAWVAISLSNTGQQLLSWIKFCGIIF